MTTYETKHDIGDIVYFLCTSKYKKGTVSTIDIRIKANYPIHISYGITSNENYYNIDSRSVFTLKEAIANLAANHKKELDALYSDL